MLYLEHSKYKVSGIYKITNKINGKIYIGQACNIVTRIRKHKNTINSKRNNYPIYYDMIKYGFDSFEVSVLEVVYGEDYRRERETFWIKKLRPEYNSTGGGIYDTPESTRKKISESRLNKIGIPINQYDIDGNFIKSWATIKLATISLNLIHTNICAVCRGKAKSTGGFIFKYATDASVAGPRIDSKARSINQYDLNGVFIKKWPSLSSASKHINVHISTLFKCLQKKQITCGGFKWEYA